MGILEREEREEQKDIWNSNNWEFPQINVWHGNMFQEAQKTPSNINAPSNHNKQTNKNKNKQQEQKSQTTLEWN